MDQDNERKEAFSFWSSATVDGYIGSDRFAEVTIGSSIVVDERGVRLRIEGARRSFSEVILGTEKERALYEALRARFDERHREAVAQAALAKLSPLEQEALRQRWGGGQ